MRLTLPATFCTLLFLLLSNLYTVMANNLPAYIINLKDDTIKGEIKVSNFDILAGTYQFSDISMKQFHTSVYFKDVNQTRFKTYNPTDIKEFGFTYKSIYYTYKSFVIATKSMIKTEKEKRKFLQLLYDGEIAVYKDIIRTNNFYNSNVPNNKVIDYEEFYLYSNKHGLKKLSTEYEFSTVLSLLEYYEVDKKFLELNESEIEIENIIEILDKYSNWKNDQ